MNGHQDMVPAENKTGIKEHNNRTNQAHILSLGVFLQFNRFQCKNGCCDSNKGMRKIIHHGHIFLHI